MARKGRGDVEVHNGVENFDGAASRLLNRLYPGLKSFGSPVRSRLGC